MWVLCVSQVTYKNLDKWYKELREYCPGIPCLVVANKIDRERPRRTTLVPPPFLLRPRAVLAGGERMSRFPRCSVAVFALFLSLPVSKWLAAARHLC